MQDDDPYVRKTAAVCVAKLHDINAELVEDRGFLDTLKVNRSHAWPSFLPDAPPHQCWLPGRHIQVSSLMCLWCLQDLLADSNPMVVANAVAALAEIHEVSGKDVFQITSQSLFKLLRALNECTEWGQVHALLQPASYM